MFSSYEEKKNLRISHGSRNLIWIKGESAFRTNGNLMGFGIGGEHQRESRGREKREEHVEDGYGSIVKKRNEKE